MAEWIKANGGIRKTVIGGPNACECEEQAIDLYNHLGNNFKFWTISLYNRTRLNVGRHGWGLDVFPPQIAHEKWNVVRVDPKTGVGVTGSGGGAPKKMTFNADAFILSPFWGYKNEDSGITVYSLEQFMQLFPDDGDYDEPSLPIPSGPMF